LIFAIVGICAAVGLGSGDWYCVEASSAPLSSPVLGSVFQTAYFGLRFGYFCAAPQSTLPYGSNSQNNGFGTSQCLAYTYRSKYLAAQFAHDNDVVQSDKDAAGNAATAFYQLIGSSGVITALLALAVVICGHQFFINICKAHGVAAAPARVPAKISLVLAIILEALVIIFWVTIFPYNYMYNQEINLLPGVSSYDTYHSLGLGFSIQIAGLLIGLGGLFSFPKDAN